MEHPPARRGSIAPVRPLPWFFALFTLFLAATLTWAPGCGPSPLRRELDAYKRQVSPLLDKEQKAYERLSELADERDQYSDPYQDWIAEQGIGLYEELHTDAAAIVPVDPELKRIHQEFVTATELMLEFLHRESATRALYDRARDSKDLAQLAELRASADETVGEYVAWVDDPRFPKRTPDWRFRKAKDAQERFERIDEGIAAGTMEVAEAKRLLRDEVLVLLKEAAEKERFLDDEGSRKLESVIVSARRLYTHLLETDSLELQAETRQAAGPAQEAVRRAGAARERFVSQFRKLDQTTR